LAAEKSIALRRELGDLDGIMWSTIGLAQHYFDAGDISQAVSLCEEGFHLAKKGKNQWGIVAAQCNLAIILYKVGEVDRAFHIFRQVLPYGRDLNEPNWTVWLLSELGHTSELLQDWQTSMNYHQQAIQIARSNHIMNAEVSAYLNLAEAARKNDRVDLARQYYRLAVEVGRDQETNYLQGSVAFASGWLAYLEGDLNLARKCFAHAVSEFTEQGNPHEAVHNLEVLAFLCMDTPEVAARFHGNADHHRPGHTNWGTMLFLNPTDLNVQLAPIRNLLGESTYSRLYEEGQAMTIEDVLTSID
jgi:tetratricopeptide (TPR) repeat protein